MAKRNSNRLMAFLEAGNLNGTYNLLTPDERIFARYLVEREHRTVDIAIEQAYFFMCGYFFGDDAGKKAFAAWKSELLHRAVDAVNDSYGRLGIAIDAGDDAAADDFSDEYEARIAHYAAYFGYTESFFEDLCTDARHFGWECC